MKRYSAITGAAFLMATSAIGPGFLTQTTLFTQELLASFGFAILISVIIDVIVQLNIWRIVTISGQRAQDLAQEILPGLGVFLAVLITIGGLIFNIGNIGGTGLGINGLTGIPVKYGAIISAGAALAVFWYKKAGDLMDQVIKVLGLIMIGLTIYVAIASHPPAGEALYRTVYPQKIDSLKIITLVGGTVGGYISFAGAHRLLDAGISGMGLQPLVTKSAVRGILITSLMRFILFFAALGVVWSGVQLTKENPAASVFSYAAGQAGYRLFGIVLWIASVTSVIGASYTTVSFWKTFSPFTEKNHKLIVSGFITASLLLFLINPKPVKLLILAGSVNGIILPLALVVILITAAKKSPEGYKHPLWLQVAGWLVAIVMTVMSYTAFKDGFLKLF